MRRRMFTFAPVVPLLLCVATVGLWVRTIWRQDALSFASTRLTAAGWAGHEESLKSLHGELIWEHWRVDYLRGNQPPQAYRGRFRDLKWESRPARQTRIDLAGQPLGRLGIGIVRIPGATAATTSMLTSFAVPYWLLVLLTFVLPTVSLSRYGWYRYRRAFTPHACPTCGYNLTGNTSGVCPECGTAIKKTVGAKA